MSVFKIPEFVHICFILFVDYTIQKILYPTLDMNNSIVDYVVFMIH